MDYDNKSSSGVAVLGVLALAAMFFAYLIHSSTKTQPIQTAQLSSLDNVHSQAQTLLDTLKNQSYQLEKMRTLQAMHQLNVPTETINEVSMPTHIERLDKDKLRFSDYSESVAASFGMV